MARLLDAEGVRYVALDLDPERVREAAAAGDTVVFADSSRREALIAAGIMRASAVALTFSDAAAAVRVLAHIRGLNPSLPVVARARDEADIERLTAAGATEVVPEAFESGVMLASHTLVLAGVPLSRVMRRVAQVRDEQYGLLRGLFHGRGEEPADGRTRLHAVTLEAGAYGAGRRLEELKLGGFGVAGARRAPPGREAQARAGRGGRAARRRRGGPARRAGVHRRSGEAAVERSVKENKNPSKKKPARGRLFSADGAPSLERAADRIDVAAGFRVGGGGVDRADRRVGSRSAPSARTVPLPAMPSSICVSTAMATLSGRLAEHMIRPTKPGPPASSQRGDRARAPLPVCTPSMPVRALNGCSVPVPATKPARRRCIPEHARLGGAGAV